ncbi:MAG: FG-GAP-like repeat-containing protein [Proteobacteria bacterium]|nr:FG-GAP-like repeat-containing protein [Pseudomonadota bacterium]
MRWISAFAFLITAHAAISAAPAAGRIETEILRHEPSHPVLALFAEGDQVIAKLATPQGPAYRALTLQDGTLGLRAIPDYRAEEPRRRPDMLPDGIVTLGQRNITAAWLTGPTRRYDHGVLGDAVEASGLRVQNRAGQTLSFTLSAESVFEDRQVRLADLNGDGGDELLVVRSYLNAGAALAVLRPGVNGLAVVAETAPIGLPHRWLNPAAVADFDGDGRVEIAVVVTPHIGGVLKLYELRQNRLRLERLHEEWSANGFSNHVSGSRIQAMAAVVDWGEGPVLHLPNAQRNGLRQVYFADGGYQIHNLANHQWPIVTAVIAADLDGDGRQEVIYGLDNGDLLAVRRYSRP